MSLMWGCDMILADAACKGPGPDGHQAKHVRAYDRHASCKDGWCSRAPETGVAFAASFKVMTRLRRSL